MRQVDVEQGDASQELVGARVGDRQHRQAAIAQAVGDHTVQLVEKDLLGVLGNGQMTESAYLLILASGDEGTGVARLEPSDRDGAVGQRLGEN